MSKKITENQVAFTTQKQKKFCKVLLVSHPDTVFCAQAQEKAAEPQD
jgi:hypothetical protein